MEAVVRKLRLGLSNWLARMMPLAAMLLRPEPPTGHIPVYFKCRGYATDPDHHVYVAWRDDTSKLPNKFNTTCLLVMDNVWIWVNLEGRASLVIPMEPKPGGPLAWINEHLAPTHVAYVPCQYVPTRWTPVIGPVTCTTLAKKVIGLQDSGLHTASELLARLWRDR